VERSSERGWLVRLPERLRRARALEVAAGGVTYRGAILTRARCDAEATSAAHASQTLDSFVLPDVQLRRRVARDDVDWSSAPIDARRLTARRWAVTLPAHLHRANVLTVSTGWPGGDAYGAVGHRVPCGS
jgi:hypothetical protein